MKAQLPVSPDCNRASQLSAQLSQRLPVRPEDADLRKFGQSHAVQAQRSVAAAARSLGFEDLYCSLTDICGAGL